MRLLIALTLSLIAAGSQAAQVVVHLPENAGIRVWDPDDESRIDCSPTKTKCAHQSPGNGHEVSRLRVEPLLDPRTGARDENGGLRPDTGTRPWDIIAMPGCRGTSALPADNGVCFLPLEGAADIYFEVRYRPILAVTYSGSYGGPLNFAISGGPGTDYQGSGSGFACYPNVNPQTWACSSHLTAGQPVRLIAPSTIQATLEAVSPPCGAADCEFTLTQDTCIQYNYKNGDPGFFQTVALSPIECPTGPGTTGGGGGGGGGGPQPPNPVPDGVRQNKEYALQQMRIAWEQTLYPCLVLTGGIAVGILGPPGFLVGLTLESFSAPRCIQGVRRIQQLQLIYNDPPNLDFHLITPVEPTARPSLDLPDCAQLSGDERRLCKKLGKAAVRDAAKDARATAVAEALRITVEKAVGAFEADEQGALRRQLKAATKLRKQHDAALVARAKAGAKLASLMRDAGVTVTLTDVQFGEAATILLGRLAAEGFPETEARTLLEPVLAPRPLDVLTVLGQP